MACAVWRCLVAPGCLDSTAEKVGQGDLVDSALGSQDGIENDQICFDVTTDSSSRHDVADVNVGVLWLLHGTIYMPEFDAISIS